MDDKSFSRKVVSEAGTGGTTTVVTMFASLSRWSPKELLQRDSKYVKNTLYIHLIIIIDYVTMSLYIYIHILIYFPLIQTCRLMVGGKGHTARPVQSNSRVYSWIF